MPRKVKLSVLETLKYRREIIMEVPDDTDDYDVEEALKLAEKNDNIEDFIMTLDDAGMTLTEEGYDNDLSSPFDMEIECEEYDYVKEESGND